MSIKVLLSGGLDSALVMAMAIERHCNPETARRVIQPVFVEYGQRHLVKERASALMIANYFGCTLDVVEVRTQGGALTEEHGELDAESAVVPGRNLAMIRACLPADEVWFGPTLEDHGVFEDCRLDFVMAAESELGVRVRAPLLGFTKADVIASMYARGMDLAVEASYSCYQGDHQGDEAACGFCGACSVRLKGFYELGLPDPQPYRNDAYRRPCPTCKTMGKPTPPGSRCHHPSLGWCAPHSGR